MVSTRSGKSHRKRVRYCRLVLNTSPPNSGWRSSIFRKEREMFEFISDFIFAFSCGVAFLVVYVVYF